MEKFFMAVFAAIFESLRGLIVIGLAISLAMLIAKLLCNINPDESYSWISGIWHGLFVIPNYARSVLSPEILYKAVEFTSLYNIFWWIAVVLQTPTMLLLLFHVVINPIAAAFFVLTDN